MADDIGAHDASIEVTSDQPVIPERSMYTHVTYPGGHTPPYPEAMRLGYRRVSLGGIGAEGEMFRLEPRGEQLGVITRTVHGTRLHLDPDTTMSVILSSARKAGGGRSATVMRHS